MDAAVEGTCGMPTNRRRTGWQRLGATSSSIKPVFSALQGIRERYQRRSYGRVIPGINHLIQEVNSATRELIMRGAKLLTALWVPTQTQTGVCQG
jgi:hypothetical protein